MTWPTVPASELILKRGGSVNPSKFPDETFELLSIPAFDKNEPEILSGSEIGSSKSCIEPGDVLLSKIVPHIRRCWVVPEKREYRQIGSGEWIIFRDDRFDKGFLKHFLTSDIFHRQFMNTVAGVGGSLVRARPAEVERIEIPLPPLAEQKRIATILDKADAIRRKRQQAIQLADDFLRAVFLDMFSEVVTPSGYESVQKFKIIDLVDYIDYRGKTPEKSVSGVPLITAKNVKSGYVDDEPREYIPEDNYDAWMTRGIPKENDVLFTTEAPLGNVALLGKYEKVAVGQRLIALRSKGRVTHEYLLYLLLHPFIQDLIYARSSGSTVKGIRTKELYAIELPVPEIEKQREFSSIYWKFTSLKKNQESAFQENNLNFKALSQKAFRGEL